MLRTLQYLFLIFVGLVLSGLVVGLLVPFAGEAIGRGAALGLTAAIVLGVVVVGSRVLDRRAP